MKYILSAFYLACYLCNIHAQTDTIRSIAIRETYRRVHRLTPRLIVPEFRIFACHIKPGQEQEMRRPALAVFSSPSVKRVSAWETGIYYHGGFPPLLFPNVDVECFITTRCCRRTTYYFVFMNMRM